jgi:hypothetical protein
MTSVKFRYDPNFRQILSPTFVHDGSFREPGMTLVESNWFGNGTEHTNVSPLIVTVWNRIALGTSPTSARIPQSGMFAFSGIQTALYVSRRVSRHQRKRLRE